MSVRRAKAGRWPVLPVAPAIVALLALATAALIAMAAAKQLQSTSDDAAALRSKALAATLAARMRFAPVERRAALLTRAGRRTGASFVLVSKDGTMIFDQPLAAMSEEHVARLLAAAEGLTETPRGRARYAAAKVGAPLSHLSVMAFVEAPSPADGTVRLSNAIGVLTLLLLGVAVTVALLFTRTARDDVAYVRQRIADMARGASDASDGISPNVVPLRSLDQVGLLTAALNNLIQRFESAEQGYREDLRAAARLDTERSQFLAGLSHELRTPLNAILGFTHLLESEDDGPLSVDAKEALAMIRTSGEHLKTLIDDILDLSAMETGQLRLSRALVDVASIAEGVVREARATVLHRDVKLSVIAERGNIAWADPRRLRQVLTNLVSNALKATAEGEVSIRVFRAGSPPPSARAPEGVSAERLAAKPTSAAPSAPSARAGTTAPSGATTDDPAAPTSALFRSQEKRPAPTTPTTTPHDMIAIEVADTGRGIDKDVLDTIFEPYKQAGDAQARRGGAGLGLAITRRLVLLHGGTITAKSVLGRGSVFTIMVPDDSHSAKMPRDSLVPFSDSPEVIASSIIPSEEA